MSNPDGSEELEIDASPGEPLEWSPDKTKIAFILGGSAEDPLYVIDADGSNKSQLVPTDTAAGMVGGFDWSPDSSQIVFALRWSDAEAQRRAYVGVVDVSTGEITELTDSRVDRYQPTWSPDGTHIAFVQGRQIWVMNSDGSDERRLTEIDGAGHQDPAWSPDGQRLAFTVFRRHAGVWDLGLVNVDGSRLRRFKTSTGELHPMFSPTGEWLAFLRSTEGSYAFRLTVMRPGGRDRHLIASRVDSDTLDSYDWSPSGSYLVFVGINPKTDASDRDLYVSPVSGDRRWRVARTPGYEYAVDWAGE